MTDTAPTPKLSLATKLAYGVGDLGPALVSAINGFFLNAFLIEVAGIRPATAALIFLLVKIWDAVNDPIVGTLTDRTNTRWGRRRPWLLFGAVPFALAFFLQWVVPDWSSAGLFWYYLLVALLLDTGFTAVNVPYAALTPELTQDYDERTSLNAYRFSFSILGGTVAAFTHTIIVAGFEGTAVLRGYLISAGIWAGVIILSNLITFAFTRESHFSKETDVELPFFEGLKIAFKNRAFITVTVIYLLAWLSIQFVQNNLLLYVKYWVQAEDQFQWLLLILQIGTFVWLLIWVRVSARWGKQRVYYAGASAWIVASIAIFFVPRGQVTVLYGLGLLASAGVSVCYLIPWSLLPDVIELDELETGQRREGIYYGFFVFLQKLGISLGLAASNLVLDVTGYVKPDYPGAALAPIQPEAVLTSLRVFVSFIPAIILLLSFIMVARYPITRQRHAEIRAALAARPQGDDG
jgi:GPH family glycoside/pentoside/hexuronide:cation symporter